MATATATKARSKKATKRAASVATGSKKVTLKKTAKTTSQRKSSSTKKATKKTTEKASPKTVKPGAKKLPVKGSNKAEKIAIHDHTMRKAPSAVPEAKKPQEKKQAPKKEEAQKKSAAKTDTKPDKKAEQKQVQKHIKGLSVKDLEKELADLPDWELNKTQTQIAKTFLFPNFVSALAFVAKVTVHAEVLDHHPDIELSYGKVKVKLTTHATGGLTKLDFALALRIDGIQVRV